jgi:gluconate 2-dehydrogenase gamma chain
MKRDTNHESSAAPSRSLAERDMNVSRRDVLTVGVAGVVLTACSGEGTKQPPAQAESQLGRRYLNDDQSDALNAVLDRLIPSDELGPGAGEARGEKFVEHMLRHSYTNEYRGQHNPHANLRDAYTHGLAALDASALQRHGLVFAKLSNEQQDGLLQAMQANEVSGFQPDSRSFFSLLRQHAIEGMFGDPCYGGNAHFAGWKLLGFPGVRLAFAEEETKLGVDVAGENRSVLDYSMFGRDGI